MKIIFRVAVISCVFACSLRLASSQQVVRITEPSAVNPAEVSIAINPKNPDNMIAASFQTGRPPKPRAGSYQYVTFDGGKTWKTVATPNPNDLTQGDDVVAFSNDGVAYHTHLSFAAWMAVDPGDGSVNVVFYDRRDSSGTQTSLTLARSVDGGHTFVNHKIDLPPFNANSRVFFGDYSSISAFKGRVVPVFMHFIDEGRLAVSVALFRFKPGSQELAK